MNSRYAPLILQLMRFGVVGFTAAMLHLSIVIALVQLGGLPPLMANIVGFGGGFQVSYWGHRRFTFNVFDTPHRVAISKLLLIQLINLAANETLFYIFLQYHLPYIVALFLVLSILPVFTFLSSKLWVFKGRAC